MLTAGLQQASAEQMVKGTFTEKIRIEDQASRSDITEGERGTLEEVWPLGAMAKETGLS